jgi:CubicO group peptidase (beta-lactamase class C family)
MRAVSTPSPAALDGVLDAAWARLGVSGSAVALVHPEAGVHIRTFGVRSVETGEPVTAGTLFATASITKTFTAAAAATLVQDGVLGWDAPVAEWVPEARLGPPHGDLPLTLRDLLSHRTGLGRNVVLEADSRLDSEALLARFPRAPIVDPWRARATYSNLGYLAAGTMLARAAGRSWAQLVDERVVRALGLRHTVVDYARTGAHPALAHAHEVLPGGTRVIARTDRTRHAPASVIYATIEDLAGWVGYHARGAGPRGPLSAASFATMTTAQVPAAPNGRWPWQAAKVGVGLGWHLSEPRGVRFAYHDGGVQGYASFAGFAPERGTGVAVLSNASDDAFQTAVVSTAIDWMTDAGGTDWVEAVAATRTPPRTHDCSGAPSTPDGAGATGWAGVYEADGLGTATVDERGDCLTISFDLAPRWRYHLPAAVTPGDQALVEDVATGRVDDADGPIVLGVDDGGPWFGSLEVGRWSWRRR